MAEPERDRPSIHVGVTAGAEPGLYRWVEIGAEEEGVPCRQAPVGPGDLVAATYATAQGSRFNVGVVVGPDRVILHETHMPPEQPVLNFAFNGNAATVCRLMGSNAARMVVRLPFRFVEDELATERNKPAPVPKSQPKSSSRPVVQPAVHATNNPGQVDIAALARAIAGKVAVRQSGPAQMMESPAGDLNNIEVKLIAKVIARILKERGIQ